MIAKLWADSVINGKKNLDQVPRQLKDRVLEILNEYGYTNPNIE